MHVSRGYVKASLIPCGCGKHQIPCIESIELIEERFKLTMAFLSLGTPTG
jgi:hypothetical protein